MRAGVIVAGGHSIRFGDSDKVVADLAGVPMIRWVAERFACAVDDIIVCCRSEQIDEIADAVWGVDTRFVTDTTPDSGPIAGIHAGLSGIGAEYTAVVAADMPFVDPEFISYLFDRAENADTDGSLPAASGSPVEAVVPRSGDGWFQVTQAVYRTDPTADACAAMLTRGEYRITAVLSELDYLVISEEEIREQSHPRTFTNLNTKEAFAQASVEIATTERSVPDIG